MRSFVYSWKKKAQILTILFFANWSKKRCLNVTLIPSEFLPPLSRALWVVEAALDKNVLIYYMHACKETKLERQSNVTFGWYHVRLQIEFYLEQQYQKEDDFSDEI